MESIFQSNPFHYFFDNTVSFKGWSFWLLVLLLFIFLLWLFFGGKKYEYIGLSPMKIGVDSTKFANGHTYAAVAKSNLTARKITGSDLEVSYVTTRDERSEGNHPQEGEKSNCRQNNFVSSRFTNVNNVTLPVKHRGRKISKGEQKCKETLEKIYGKEFLCVRPDFLRNPETNRKLELDCYNEELKLAVEYNGIQHYK